jgi:Family of unknown function (DUF5941)
MTTPTAAPNPATPPGQATAGPLSPGNQPGPGSATGQEEMHGDRLIAYRDDGPIAALLGRLTGGQLPPLPSAMAGGLITAVLLLVGIGELTGPLLFGPVAALMLSGPAATHPHNGRLDWLVPPIIRATEYAYLGVLGFAQDISPPLVYALLGVLAYHHYDTVYRTRQRLWPAPWVFRAGLGWEGRTLIAAVAAFAGVLPLAYAVLTTYLGLLFVTESVATWTRTERGTGVMVNLEEEEEAGS